MPAEFYFRHDNLDFHYLDVGSGLPFVFQHGLGGDVSQPFELYAPQPGVRLLTMDSRGHGMTRPIGAAEKFSFASFADDLWALLDHLDLQKAVVGGISMGAGVALNFALRYPERAVGLCSFGRPGWRSRCRIICNAWSTWGG